MRQVFRKIPVYAGDVSGVCSALYEMGGMIVMHDPSGCNSTYNTHDEVRWYDRDSLIFLSGLNEMDAILGNDDRLVHDVVETARLYAPAFIAIANSPIPYITGTDFEAVCRLIEQQTGIPAFYIQTNGMHDYVHGAGLAFLQIAKRFVEKTVSGQAPDAGERKGSQVPDAGERKGSQVPDAGKRKGSQVPDAGKRHGGQAVDPGSRHGSDRQSLSGSVRCNILGMTPLDFGSPLSLDSLLRKLSDAGIEVVSCWGMGHGEALLGEIRQSRSADVNLVVSSAGLPAAEYMSREYNIPYVAGIPAPGVEEQLFDAMARAAGSGKDPGSIKNLFPFRERGRQEGRSEDPGPSMEYVLIGEPVTMTSLAASITKRTGCSARVFATTETSADIIGWNPGMDGGPFEHAGSGPGAFAPADGDAVLRGEEELADALLQEMNLLKSRNEAAVLKVIADPCFRDIIPEDAALIRLPHLAFSGRLFLREMTDLINFHDC